MNSRAKRQYDQTPPVDSTPSRALGCAARAPPHRRLRRRRRTARVGNRRFGLLSALRSHTKAPYKIDLLWETLRVLKRPGRARTVQKPWYVRIHDE